jgi:hypothetical protein
MKQLASLIGLFWEIVLGPKGSEARAEAAEVPWLAPRTIDEVLIDAAKSGITTDGTGRWYHRGARVR